MQKKRIAVLFGGCSAEHEVSRVSAYSVMSNLPKDKYEIVPVGITKDGRWFLYSGPIDKIPNGEWESGPSAPAFLSPDRSVGGLVVFSPEGTRVEKVDCVFPVLHGRNGEDGTIQGLLELSGLPFVGCGTLASAVCMDKAETHSLLLSAGIACAKYLWFYRWNYAGDGAQKIRAKIAARLGYPVFVKPANSGSSVGVTKAKCEEELDAAVAAAAAESDKILVEEAVSGQEVECAVIGNHKPEAAGKVGEILAAAVFYDYDDKYKSGKSKVVIPAQLSSETAEEIRSAAVRAFRMLGCRGFARVDFFVRNGREVLLNELNTIPGFTPISMYPKLWDACGVSYGELLDRLICLSFEDDAQDYKR